MPLIQIRDHTFMGQLLSPESVVLDLGANHGDSSVQIQKQFGGRCVLVEANPKLCEKIRQQSRLQVVNAAVAAESGNASFYICGNDESSSLLDSVEENSRERIEVPALSFVDLIEQHQLSCIDLLKVDIEGAEIEIFNQAPAEVLLQIPLITVEFHDFNGLVPQADVIRVTKRMQNLGFRMIRMWMQSYGDTLFINRKLANVTHFEFYAGKLITRNWWWTRRFLASKLLSAKQLVTSDHSIR